MVRYAPGKDLVIADALSRSPIQHNIQDPNISQVIDEHVVCANWPVSKDKLQDIKQASEDDDDLPAVMNFVLRG